MEIPPEVWAQAHEIVARASNNSTTSSSSSSADPHRPPVYKVIGLILAICSGLFIGTSFVLKKTGLLRANAKYNEEAGEGYGYLKNAYWWTGMTLMIVGEICNFVAYAFVDAILVTPLGALSVVVTTILSAIFLKERLSFVGKVGCFNCIVGSVIIVMNAPQQSAVADIQEMKHFVIAPGFLSYAGVILVGCAFIAFWVAPRYGKKSMLVYLSICSLIGGISVVCTQGLGSAIVAQAGGKPQFNQWFLYLLLVVVIATLLTEIIYLNKALNLFNAALVTPTYYVFFTSATIITSAVLFQGFKGTAISIATVIMGFLQICAGVVLLQLSKSAKDVPDAAVFKGDLDQVREVAEQEQPETEPKADAIRAGASIIRRFSQTRQKMEQEEAKRLRQDTLKDQLEPLAENEVVEWDGLRRRKTVIESDNAQPSTPVRRKTTHPPLGMSRFPNPNEAEQEDSNFFENLRHRAQSLLPHQRQHAQGDLDAENMRSPVHPVALTEINVHAGKPPDTPIIPYGPGSYEQAQERIFGYQPPPHSPRSKPLPKSPNPQAPQASLSAPRPARRQFSFQNYFSRQSRNAHTPELPPPPSRQGLSSRQSSYTHEHKRGLKSGTEEESMGLAKGDSYSALLPPQEESRSRSPPKHYDISRNKPTHSDTSSIDSISYPYDDYDDLKKSMPVHRPERLSDSDEDDEWQITTPPNTRRRPPAATNISNTQVQQPLHNQNIDTQLQRAPSQRRPSPPPIYQDTLSQTPINPPRQMQRNPDAPPTGVSRNNNATPRPVLPPAPPAGQRSGHSQTSSTSRSLTHDPSAWRTESGTSLQRVESPEDYETSRKRWEDRQGRPAARPGGGAGGSNGPAFI